MNIYNKIEILMKKWKILIPSLIIVASAPLVSLAACSGNKPQPVVQHTITFSAGKHGSIVGDTTTKVNNGTLWKDVVKPSTNHDEHYSFIGWFNGDHQMVDTDKIETDVTIEARFTINEHKVTFLAGEHGKLEGQTEIIVQGNKTKLSEITKPTIVDIDAGWIFKGWDHSDDYIINNDVTVTALYEFDGEIIDLIEDITEKKDYPKTESKPFVINKDKVYRFNINASICPPESFIEPTPQYYSSFFIYEENTRPKELVEFSIEKLIVRDVIFSKVESPEQLTYGKYIIHSGMVIIYDYNLLDPSFTMSIELQFAKNIDKNAIARWYGET